MILRNLLDAIYEVTLRDELALTGIPRELASAACMVIRDQSIIKVVHTLTECAELAQRLGCVLSATYINKAIESILEG